MSLPELAAAAATLTALDLAWIQVGAPAVGFDYLKVVASIQGAPAAGRPLGLLAYPVMGIAAWRGASAGLARAGGEPSPAAGAAGAAEIGFFIYAVYDLTNTFLFTGWRPALAAVDTLWGTLAFAAAGAVVGAVRAWRGRQ
jgi:hypothetical protein